MRASAALLALAAASAALPAAAQPARGSPAFNACVARANGVTADLADCQTREIARSDAQLNAVYKSAMLRLPQGRRDALRADERRWIAFRDRACNGAASADAGGTAAGLDGQNCRIDKTRERTAYLQTYR